MPFEIVSDAETLAKHVSATDDEIIVGFFGEFSEASRKARPTFEAWCASHGEIRALLVDVASVKNAHQRYGVTSVPTVIAVREGNVTRSVVGVQSVEFLSRALLGERTEREQKAASERGHRVTVFVTDTCPWCTRVKTYLRENQISYSEVNVQRDEQAMRNMVARSGQQGVPQLDIDGSFIVGFDKPRIDAMLGLRRSA